MISNKKNIVVLGGGYAGIMAALRIAGKTKRLDTAVTLINALDYFVERPRLHEQATGTQLNGRSITDMLTGSNAQFLQGWVTGINPNEQTVVVETAVSTQTLPYDYLVNALGSRVDRGSVLGVDEHTFTLDPYGKLSTKALNERLDELGSAPFQAIIIGGGATGLEAATQIKARSGNGRISLITQGNVGAFKGPRIQKHIQQALHEQEITVFEHRRVVAVEEGAVQLDNERMTADVLVWAGGFVASPLARDAGVMVNVRNQIKTDPFLRSLSHPTLYAVGDMAFPVEEPGAPWRMSLFTALVSGAQAADNIVAVLKGKSQRPLSYAWYGQGIAMGLHDAVGFNTYPVDKPVGPVFRRGTAVKIRNFFVALLKTALELERRFPGVLTWNGKKRYAQQQKRQKQQQAVTQP